MELDDDIYYKIEALSQEGNDLCDGGDFNKALQRFTQAFELLPPPPERWDAYVWLSASIGDTYFSLKRFSEAATHFFDANSITVDPNPNPFVLLRLGQSLVELGREDEAVQYLARAYMLAGREIFAGESPRYLRVLAASGFKLE